MNYKSYTDLSNDISKNIYKLQVENYDLIVGIPRSGMIPAYMIALLLNKNCTDINSFINNSPLQVGITRKVKEKFRFPSEARNILIVDDSIFSGKSLAKILDSIPKKKNQRITTLAIYSSEPKRNDVSIFLEYVSTPRLFQWNIFHHDVVTRSCFDIDGVLCVDPTAKENDDGEKYIEFILNAKPLILPTERISYLVTSRLEKYRKETELWLKKNEIDYEKLIMLNLPSKEERLKLGAHAEHKANAYKKSGLELFVESDPKQAFDIHQITKKPVFCVNNNKMYDTNTVFTIIHNNNLFLRKRIVNFAKKLPDPIYKFGRMIYRFIKIKK